MKQATLFMLKTAFFLTSVFLSRNETVAQSLMAANAGSGKIQYIRTEGDLLVFDLRLTNLPEAGSVIRITDDESNVLFEERISATVYNKRYKILRDNIDKLHFEIINRRVIVKQSFQVRYRVEEKWEAIKA